MLGGPDPRYIFQTSSGTLTCKTHINVPEQVGVLGATLTWIQANVGRATLTWGGTLVWGGGTLTWVGTLARGGAASTWV